MAVELKNKMQAFAEIIGGRVLDGAGRVAVSLKGTVDGYPASLEAILPHWPFGVMYAIESSPIEDANVDARRPSAMIVLYPRVGRGVGSVLTNLLLFEGATMKVNNKRLHSNFNFQFNNKEVADRLLNNEQVADLLCELDEKCKFSEIKIRTDAGAYLAQPKSFNALTPEMFEETFRLLSALADILSTEF